MIEGTIKYNEGTLLLGKKKYSRALRCFKEAIALGSDNLPELWLNLGNVHKANNDFAAAGDCYAKAVNLRPGYKLAQNNLGLVYHGMGRDSDALELYNLCETKNAGYLDVKWNKSLHLMRAASQTNNGWLEAYNYYNTRFMKESQPVKVKLDFGALPIWDGVATGRVVVVAEQGAGDLIQFARFVRRDGSMAMQCDATLAPFLREAFGPLVEVAEYFDWKEFDYWIPICSLGQFSSLSGAPWVSIEDMPYSYDFGYVWHGNPSHANDHNRSTTLGRFKQLSKGLSTRSFQFGEAGFDKKPLVLRDYLDTALELKKCRRLITVDTSIAHLAGSIGVETWVLLPEFDVDWRWGSSGSTSTWYDSVRLFRNTHGWHSLFEDVKKELNK